MLTLSSELLLSVFAHVDHAKLDLLLRTSRTLREIARRQIAQKEMFHVVDAVFPEYWLVNNEQY